MRTYKSDHLENYQAYFAWQNLHEEQWEGVLPEALHAVRSLVCLSTNETSHERFFRFPRRAMFGTALPSWLLSPGTVLLRRFVRNKSEPLLRYRRLGGSKPALRDRTS